MCDSLCCVTFQFSTLLYVLCDSLCCVNFRCSVFLFVLNDSLCCVNFQCSVFLYASSSLSALEAEIHSAGTLLTVRGGSKEAVGHASPLRCLAPTGLPVTCSTIFTDDVTCHYRNFCPLLCWPQNGNARIASQLQHLMT